MKKKNLFFVALAALVLASCSSDEFIGENNSPTSSNGVDGAINFGFNVPVPTRANQTGSDAATLLGNQFIVYGEKSESAATAATAANLVFKNYQVNWAANTAYTTTSNTKDWEYVGYTHSTEYQNNIMTKDGASVAEKALSDAQTIKFWDYSASNYVFTAVSALQSDITAGNVTIQKNTSGSTIHDKGYTLTLTASADPSKVFVADRKVISPTAGTDRTAENTYGGNVTLTFRNLLSHVRVGMFETISGYTVTMTKFYYKSDGTPDAFSAMDANSTTNFVANVPNVATSSGATLNITYQTSGTTKNQPTIAISGTTQGTHLQLGTNVFGAALATSSATPTWDTDGGTYTAVYPQEANTGNLKLKVDYQLTSPTGEVINVTGATAEIPAEYLKWKPNYKYTYLFKISENTNGSTGQDVVGLYPITFDAVVVEAEDGQAEYITTVSEPSITTFGVSGGKYVGGKSEYEAGNDIYATIMDGNSVVDFTLGTNVKVYQATTTDAANFPITEASVAESIAEISAGTKKVTVTKINDDASTYFTAAPAKVTTVPGEDGVDKTVNALKLTGAKATTATTALVVEYVKTAATYNTTGQTYADVSAFSAAGTLYTDADGTTVAASWTDGTTYYKRNSVKTVGSYAYKVIRVEAVAP